MQRVAMDMQTLQRSSRVTVLFLFLLEGGLCFSGESGCVKLGSRLQSLSLLGEQF